MSLLTSLIGAGGGSGDSTGINPGPPYISNASLSNYTRTFAGGFESGGTKAVTSGNIYFNYILIPENTAFDQAIVNFTSVTSCTVAVTLYSLGTNGLPTTSAYATAFTEVTTTGNSALTFSETVAAGWYLMGVACSAGSGTMTARKNTDGQIQQFYVDAANPTNSPATLLYTGTASPLPEDPTVGFSVANLPAIYLRRA